MCHDNIADYPRMMCVSTLHTLGYIGLCVLNSLSWMRGNKIQILFIVLSQNTRFIDEFNDSSSLFFWLVFAERYSSTTIHWWCYWLIMWKEMLLHRILVVQSKTKCLRFVCVRAVMRAQRINTNKTRDYPFPCQRIIFLYYSILFVAMLWKCLSVSSDYALFIH